MGPSPAMAPMISQTMSTKDPIRTFPVKTIRWRTDIGQSGKS